MRAVLVHQQHADHDDDMNRLGPQMAATTIMNGTSRITQEIVVDAHQHDVGRAAEVPGYDPDAATDHGRHQSRGVPARPSSPPPCSALPANAWTST